MKHPYPSTGELMIKSCTAIEHLARSVGPNDLPSLCKSIAAGLPGTPKAKVMMKAAPKAKPEPSLEQIMQLCKAIYDLMGEDKSDETLALRNSCYGYDTTQFHHGHEAQKEMRKCMAVMRDQRMPASDIVKFQKLTEAALANPAIDNGMLTKSLVELRNS